MNPGPGGPITAVVLAGGESRRMGQDKSLLPLDGVPMIQHIVDQLRRHFTRILVSANDPARYAFLGLPVCADRVPGQGPLMALASVLDAVDTDQVFLLPCDMPQVDAAAVEKLLDLARYHPCVVARTAAGKVDPLFAIYHRAQLPAANQLLAQGKRRIFDLLDASEVHYAVLDRAPTNLNTPEDLDHFLRGAAD